MKLNDIECETDNNNKYSKSGIKTNCKMCLSKNKQLNLNKSRSSSKINVENVNDSVLSNPNKLNQTLDLN